MEGCGRLIPPGERFACSGAHGSSPTLGSCRLGRLLTSFRDSRGLVECREDVVGALNDRARVGQCGALAADSLAEREIALLLGAAGVAGGLVCGLDERP